MSGPGQDGKESGQGAGGKAAQGEFKFVFDEFTKAIRAKMVKQCGTRDYWEEWAKDIAQIAQRHITRIEQPSRGGPAQDGL